MPTRLLFFDAWLRETSKIKIGIASIRTRREPIDADYRVARNDIALCARVAQVFALLPLLRAEEKKNVC